MYFIKTLGSSNLNFTKIIKVLNFLLCKLFYLLYIYEHPILVISHEVVP